jgi:GNAT superfamily N-acetyltransferase
MNVRIRLLNFADIPMAMRLKDGAGWNQTALDWERFISANPGGCFAAEADGRLIGTSTTIIYEGKLAWIGMVIVEPEFRGQGIGTTLLKRAIDQLDSRKIPTMKLDATPQGRPLYEKFGFVAEYKIERWMLERAGSEAVIRQAPEKLEEVLRLDRAVFGADRSKLLRSLAASAPELTLAAKEEIGLAGYTFGRHGSRADQLGPWMAHNEDVAAILLDEFLRRSSRDFVFVDCVGRNSAAVPLVKARGFELSRPLTRMFRGTNQNAGKPELLYGSLGPEFG